MKHLLAVGGQLTSSVMAAPVFDKEAEGVSVSGKAFFYKLPV